MGSCWSKKCKDELNNLDCNQLFLDEEEIKKKDDKYERTTCNNLDDLGEDYSEKNFKATKSNMKNEKSLSNNLPKINEETHYQYQDPYKIENKNENKEYIKESNPFNDIKNPNDDFAIVIPKNEEIKKNNEIIPNKESNEIDNIQKDENLLRNKKKNFEVSQNEEIFNIDKNSQLNSEVRDYSRSFEKEHETENNPIEIENNPIETENNKQENNNQNLEYYQPQIVNSNNDVNHNTDLPEYNKIEYEKEIQENNIKEDNYLNLKSSTNNQQIKDEEIKIKTVEDLIKENQDEEFNENKSKGQKLENKEIDLLYFDQPNKEEKNEEIEVLNQDVKNLLKNDELNELFESKMKPDESFHLPQEGIQRVCSQSVCSIQTTSSNGTGFLIKAIIKGKHIKFIVTTESILNKNYVISSSFFSFSFNNRTNSRDIEADSTQRKIFCFEKSNDCNITLVEIKEDIPDEWFLEVECSNNYDSYLNNDIISVEEPKQEEPIVIVQGKIIHLLDDGYSFIHNAYSDELTLGAPIISNNQKVIGICTGKENNMCKATFLSYAINKIENMLNE